MSEQVVLKIPISNLWDASGPLPIVRLRTVGRSDITALLAQDAARFVVIRCGEPLTWVPSNQTYSFWKNELKPRLVEPQATVDGFRLEEYPGEYCYIASEWGSGNCESVIALEAYH